MVTAESRVMREARLIVVQTITARLRECVVRARDCGCYGCQGDARDVVAWSREMIDGE